jgi:predicted AlkP superfamily phosphohydrolase/phosphomutase
VVMQVAFPHQEFPGPFADGLPDLTILWDQSFAWHEIVSPALGHLKIRTQDSRSGSHTPRGFLLASGYSEVAQDIGRASLYDIAPTVLHAAGLSAPASMQGRPLFVEDVMERSTAV